MQCAQFEHSNFISTPRICGQNGRNGNPIFTTHHMISSVVIMIARGRVFPFHVDSFICKDELDTHTNEDMMKFLTTLLLLSSSAVTTTTTAALSNDVKHQRQLQDTHKEQSSPPTITPDRLIPNAINEDGNACSCSPIKFTFRCITCFITITYIKVKRKCKFEIWPYAVFLVFLTRTIYKLTRIDFR